MFVDSRENVTLTVIGKFLEQLKNVDSFVSAGAMLENRQSILLKNAGRCFTTHL